MKLVQTINPNLAVNVVTSLILLAVLLTAYYAATMSSAFQLKTVQIVGNSRVSSPDIESTVRELVAKSVLNADLEAIRSRLKQRPIVKEANVFRILPDKIKVVVAERQPVATVARVNQTPVCVDEDAVVLGDFRLMADKSPPLVFGWDEDESPLAMSENRQRIAIYKQLEKELTNSGQDDWSKIDQINLRNLQDVVLNLSDSPMTWIHLGDKEFGSRFALSMQILTAVRRHDAAELRRLGIMPSDEMMQADVTVVSYIDVSQPSRAVIRLPEVRRTLPADEKQANDPKKSKPSTTAEHADRAVKNGGRKKPSLRPLRTRR
jgi:cell division protein FtsQ